MEAIEIRCVSCQHSLRVSADKAGRKVKCPRCESVLTIPAQEQTGEEPVTLAPARKTEADEEVEGYGVTVDHELAERRRRIEEEDRRKAKEAKKKKAPKVKRKFKELPDADEWDKVKFGLLFIFFGTLIWAFSHALHGMWVVLGTVEFREYARMVVEQIEGQPPPPPGRFWEINQLNLLVGIVGGRAFTGFAKICLIVETLLYVLQSILWFVGYFICLSVPNRYGSIPELVVQMILGGINFLVVIFLKLLPLVGAYQYFLIPYLIPEVCLAQYNMERQLPFHILWSGAPFWENFLNLILQFMFYLQPTFGAMFIWSVGLAIKERRLEDNATGVTQLGLGTFFMLMAYFMISLCGTSPVLVNVLRIIYTLWWSFLMMFIVRSILLVHRARTMLDAKINPE